MALLPVPIDIDGSVSDGGGKVLEISLAFSTLCRIAIHVRKIRIERKKAGLRALHLKAIALLSKMLQATVEGAEIGSTRIEFIPDRIKIGEFISDTQTVSNLILLLQVGLSSALHTTKRTTLDLCMGMNADMTPQIIYMAEVFRPTLQQFGVTFDFELLSRDYPKGGGDVRLKIDAIKSFNPILKTDQGNPIRVYGWAYVTGALPLQIANRMANSAIDIIHEHVTDIPVQIKCCQDSANMAKRKKYSGIILMLETTSGCILSSLALGKRGVTAEQSGIKAAEELLNMFKMGACVDNYIQAQLIIFMALADGVSQISIGPTVSQHIKAAIYVAQQATKATFDIGMDKENHSIIECRGIGFKNNQFT